MNNFEEIYKKTIRKMGDLVEDIRFSRQLYLDSIQGYAEDIAMYIKKHDNILSLEYHKDKAYSYLLTHPVNVAIVSGVIGKWLKLNEADLVRLICSGLLHDIGKAKIRDSILNKPDLLNQGELEMVRNHTKYGYQLLKDLNIFDEDILSGVLYHHERQDGRGYPEQLQGDEIPLFARIIAVADIYDAMTSKKAYKDKCSPFKVVGEIEENRFESLDPRICQVFLENILNYYPGSKVRLNNDKVGTIICVNHGEYRRPVIYCGDEQINLSKERDLEIVEIILHGDCELAQEDTLNDRKLESIDITNSEEEELVSVEGNEEIETENKKEQELEETMK